MNTDDQRKAFEEWVARGPGSPPTTRYPEDSEIAPGQYVLSLYEHKWQAWLEASRRAQIVIGAGRAACNTLERRMRRAELESAIVLQGFDDIRQVIAEGGSTDDVLRMIDVKRDGHMESVNALNRSVPDKDLIQIIEAERSMRIEAQNEATIEGLKHDLANQELETVRQIIAKGGTTDDVLKFLDTKEA